MKIALLSRDKSFYSCQRLIEAATQRKHIIDVLDPLSCFTLIDNEKVFLAHKQQKLPKYDVVIPRIGQSLSLYALAVLRQLELTDCFSINNSISITQSRDKYHALQILKQHNIPIPATAMAYSAQEKSNIIHQLGGVPVVIKLLEGSQGLGVVLADTQQAAESMMDAFNVLNEPFLVQEYIQEAHGQDIRCFVLDGQVVASMLRKAKSGNFRSNLHLGGNQQQIQLTPQEIAIAVKATLVLGLNMAGVDILRSNKGPLVMEVNPSPGLQGIEEITGKDIAGMIIDFLEKRML